MNTSWRATGVCLLALAAGCGDPDAAVPLDAPPTVLTCDRDLDEIVGLLRSGSPTYDYDPAGDLAELVGRADAVVAGPIDSIRRSDDGETIVVESGDLLHVGPNDAAAPATRFDIEGVWAERDRPDPLASAVTIEGVDAIAFVFERGDGSGRFVTGPQGLHVGCAGSGAAAISIIEPAPPDARGRPVPDIVAAATLAFSNDAAGDSKTTPVATEALWEMQPFASIAVDGVPLVELRLGFESWDDERAEPAEPEPAVGMVASAASRIDVATEHPATGSMTFHRLDSTLEFVEHAVVEWDGSRLDVQAPEPGTYAVDLRLTYGPSAAYRGDGVLRAGAWLFVAPEGSECGAPSATPASGLDAAVSGVSDTDGCPVTADRATLDLGSLTPWFHCSPWPPTLSWRQPGAATMTQYWRYLDSSSDIELTSLPDDATPTGLFVPAGEIVTAESDPDAIFVRSDGGEAERWSIPAEQIGCA